MKVTSWNVQDAKKSQVMQKVRFLSKCHKPDIFFPIENYG